MKRIIVSLAAGFLALGGALAVKLNEQKEVSVARADDFNPANAHIRGGARMTYVAPTTSNAGWTYVHQLMMNQNSSGGGIYIRMRNYTGTITPIDVQICDNGEGGGQCWTVGGVDLNYYLYDNQGENEVECTYLYNTMIQLPVYFDGIVYLPYANYTNNAWGGARTSMNTSLIWRVTFGLQPLYNSFANFTIGDAYTAEHINFDATQLTTQALFSDHFPTENYAGDGQIIATQELFTDFNPVGKDLLGGNMIKTTTADNYQGPTADLADAAQSIFGGGFYMRVRNYTDDIWATLQVMGCDGDNSLPKANKPFYYYGLDGNYVTNYIVNANEYNGFCIPGHFDGFIYVPLSSLYNATNIAQRFDWIYGIFITIDAKSFPNRVVVFGDTFSFANHLRDGSATSHSSFAGLRNTNQFGKVCHYPGFTDDHATEWAEYFLQETYPCETAAAGVWNDYAGEFASLAAGDQAILLEAVYAGLTDAQKNTVEKAMERYDLAVARQSLTNFISRAPLASNSTNLLKINNTSTIVVGIICATVLSLSVAAFFFLKNRRKQEQ